MLPHDGIFVSIACFMAFLSGYLKKQGNDNVSVLLNIIGVCFFLLYPPCREYRCGEESARQV